MKVIEEKFMNSKYKIPFGLKNGILYEPSQVERGKLCNCICPSCNKPLIAKKGDKNKHHFAHAINHSCQTGKETAIHLAAKQIILQKKAVYLPSIEIENKLINYGIVTFDEIILETAIPGETTEFLIIPDITAKLHREIDTKSLYIEIAVTHFSEQKKINEFRKKKLSSIEIDLSGLLNEYYVDFEMIEKMIKSGNHTTWLYNQRLELENEKIKKRDEKVKREREYILNEKLNKMKALIKLYNEEKERKKYTLESNTQLLEYARQTLGINNLNSLPPFISQPCDIDALYPVDGRLVRLYIYEYFILRRKNIPKLKERAFGAKSVMQYLKSKKQLYPNKFIYDWNELIFNDDDILFMYARDDDTPNFNSKKIISNYLFRLKDVGILIYAGNYFFKLPSVVRSDGSLSASAYGSESCLSICKFCKKPLPLSAEYCENCLEVQ